jgi:hypothetical protein
MLSRKTGWRRSFFFGEKEMKDNILVITYNLNFIIKRLEKLTYEAVDYEVEQKIKQLNEKVYELSDLVEEMELILND